MKHDEASQDLRETLSRGLADERHHRSSSTGDPLEPAPGTRRRRVVLPRKESEESRAVHPHAVNQGAAE